MTKIGISKKRAIDLYSVQLQGNFGRQLKDFLEQVVGLPPACVKLSEQGKLN